jgi:urea transporter
MVSTPRLGSLYNGVQVLSHGGLTRLTAQTNYYGCYSGLSCFLAFFLFDFNIVTAVFEPSTMTSCVGRTVNCAREDIKVVMKNIEIVFTILCPFLFNSGYDSVCRDFPFASNY